MKKLFITAALASFAFLTNAQDMNSKRGTPILPEAGDWSIGFDANPLFKFAGSLLSNAGNPNGMNFNYQQNMTLVGKYMSDAETAYRLKLRIGIGSTSHDNKVWDDASTAAVNPMTTDTWKESSMNVTLGAGLQKYRGKGRLKGFYGGEVGIMLGSGKHTFSYGNAFNTTTHTAANSTDWNNQNLDGTWAYNSISNRPTEYKAGSTFGFGIRGFVGAEYFFAPKMSLSAEYGWGISSTSTGEGSSTMESANSTAVTSTTAKTGKSSEFALDVDNVGGAIVLSLYF